MRCRYSRRSPTTPPPRALFLFPTKALGQDQVTEFGELTAAAGLTISTSTYDGDTPAPIRSAIRAAGQVVVTNPDMLHSAILPHHTKWFQLFEQLRFIVIDELHTYRGVFGSHVANVLRRLLRICAHYGSHPVIVCCSATIGNPAELADDAHRPTDAARRPERRAGRRAPRRCSSTRRSSTRRAARGARPLTLAQRWALPFLRAGRQTIVFGRSRVAVEILLTGPARVAARELRAAQPRPRLPRRLPADRAAGDRARPARRRDPRRRRHQRARARRGHRPARRRRSWRAIRARSPATWQQFGRAGRRQGTSVAILVASGAPVDQYVIHHPEFLLEGTPEEARLDPDNLHVLLAHLRAATFELPFEPGEVFGPAPADDLLAFLAEEGHVRQAGDGRWYWSSENFPASEISLRTAAPENVVIIDTTPDRPRVLGEVDLFSAQVLVHERAIYIHESVQYYVDRLEWDERKAYVHRIDVDHYTYANRAVTLKPLEMFAEAPATGGRRIHGEVMVASLVTLFKKLKFLTDENVGWGPIDLPELELQTTAYWLTAEAPATRWRRDELDIALLGAGRAIQTVAAVLLMVDPRDLGLVTQVRSPHSEEPTIYLYEAVPGRGRAVRAAVAAPRRAHRRPRPTSSRPAAATTGCPACTGPRLEPDIEPEALALRLLGRARRAGRPVATAAATTVDGDGVDDASPGGSSASGRRPAARPPRDRVARAGARSDLAERLAAAVDGEVVRGPGGRRRPARDAEPAAADRPGAARAAARPAAGRRAARLPRHRDDRAGDRRRDRRVPDRPRLVGGRPVPPGPAPAARPRRGTGAARPRSRRRSRATAWLVTYNGRGFDWPLLDDAVPDGPPGRAGPRRPPRPPADRPAAVPASDGGRAAAHRGGRAARAPPRRRRRRLGDPRPLPRVPARRPGRPAGRGRPPQRPGRPIARRGCSRTSRRGYGDPESEREAPPGDLAGLAPRVRPRATPRRSARLPRRRGGPAGTRRGRRRPCAPSAPAGPGRAATGRSRTNLVVARRPGGLRRAPEPPVEPVRPDGPVRRALDDGADRRRPRPSPSPARAARDAADAWARCAAGPGRIAVVAAIELSKLREHGSGTVAAPRAATPRARRIERRRRLGRPEPALEADLHRRVGACGTAPSAAIRRAPAGPSDRSVSRGPGRRPDL